MNARFLMLSRVASMNSRIYFCWLTCLSFVTWALHDKKEYGFDLSLQNYRTYQKNKELESIIDSI